LPVEDALVPQGEGISADGREATSVPFRKRGMGGRTCRRFGGDGLRANPATPGTKGGNEERRQAVRIPKKGTKSPLSKNFFMIKED